MYIRGSSVTTEQKQPIINPANKPGISGVSEAEAEHATQALEAARKTQSGAQDGGRYS
jgi:acyl-CoA reductase-like NAD-dependent aldehyde dehydrogenase